MSQKAEKNRLYKVLEILPDASETEIKKAYRKLAMVCFFVVHFLLPLFSPFLFFLLFCFTKEVEYDTDGILHVVEISSRYIDEHRTPNPLRVKEAKLLE
jgi:hypothetical protein